MTIRKIGFLFALLFSTLYAYSQDISKYLDDGGFSAGRMILKIGYDPINGVLPLQFEHALNRRFSVEWSAGLVSLKRQNKLYSEDPLPIAASGLGYSFSGCFKIWLHAFPERSYIGLRPGVTLMSGKTFNDLMYCNYGYQRAITGKWMVAIELGVGVRIFKNTKTYGDIDITDMDSRFIFPLTIKTGYMF
jgi:hypothetical protein